MRQQIEAFKTLWPILLLFSGAIFAITGIAAKSYVGDLAMDALKSDGAKEYVQTVIAAELDAAGVARSGKIVEMDSSIKVNAKDILRVESKAERIAQILMEE